VSCGIAHYVMRVFLFFPYTSPTRKSEPAARLMMMMMMMMMMMTVNTTGMSGQSFRRWPIGSEKNVGDIIR